MILNAILGTLTGLGGQVLTIFLKQRQSKLDHKFEIEKMEMESKCAVIEVQGEIKRTETETQGQIAISELKAFGISQKVGNKANISSGVIKIMIESEKLLPRIFGNILAFLLGTVDVIRSFIRPAITIGLSIIVGYILLFCLEVLKNYFNSGGVIPMEKIWILIESIVFAAFNIWGWWFGERSMGKAIFKK